MIYLIAIPLFLQIKELLIKEKSTCVSDQNELQKEIAEKIIDPLTEKITNLELQIKKLLKEYENFKTFTVTSYFDDIQILKKDLEILKGDLPDIIDCYYHH